MITTNAEIRIEKKLSDSLYFLSVKLLRYKQWIPGMFMQISLKEKTASEPWLDGHSFSFASWGIDKARILVRKEGAFTTELIERSMEGFIASVRYPLGDFLLNSGENKVFLAGGAGISVFMSYIDYINKSKSEPCDILLFHSVKNRKEGIRNIYDNSIPDTVSVKEFITDINEPEYTGRMSFDILKNYIIVSKNTEYFICGPPKFNSYWITELKKVKIFPKVETWEN